MTNTAKPKKKARDYVMVTFGRGTAELKRNFDLIVEQGGYTNAGLARELIREGVERRMSITKPKQK